MLKWSGIEADAIDGKPYVKQSDRLDIYREHVDRLIDDGKAYPCFCSSDRLAALRYTRQKSGAHAMYDRACLHLPKVRKIMINGCIYIKFFGNGIHSNLYRMM